MRMNTVANSVVVVARLSDAEEIGIHCTFSQVRYPHFNCGNLDAGVFGQIFWEASNDNVGFGADCRIKIVYSSSDASESVLVYAIPSQVTERYAHLNREKLLELAAGWSEPRGLIRMPRSQKFYEHLLQEVARLAGLATQEHRSLLVRTQFRRPHNKLWQPIGRENAPSG